MAIATSSSIFANPSCITAWRAEARRVASNVSSIHTALSLLSELYCLNNPYQKNPLEVRQTIFAHFLQAALKGDPLATFFEGLARTSGFGCKQELSVGRALIKVAVARNCAEAKNYLALCYAKSHVVVALQLLQSAAHDGHSQALLNYQQLAEQVRIQLRRRRNIIEFSSQNRSRLSVLRV